MRKFSYEGLPARVVFGEGALSAVTDEVMRLGARSALVLCTPGQRLHAENISNLLGALAAGIYDKAQMHVPAEIADEARKMAAAVGADCCVAVGGGSTIGLGKAIALTSGLPVIAIPSTFSGSEATPIFGITEQSLKRTGRDIRVLPKTVIYDPALAADLPPGIAVTSSLNAMAHAVEALYSETANPVTNLMAEESIRAIAHGLPQMLEQPGNLDAVSDVLQGAWLAGTCLGTVGMALHHKLCHTLGGTLNLPHADTHAVLLPHVVAYNHDAAPQAMARLARALNTQDPVGALHAFAKRVGAPQRLADIGMREADIKRVAQLATQNPYYNPRAVEYEGILGLLEGAYYV